MNHAAKELTLRELKFAKTRYNILQSFLKLSQSKEYEAINIEEVCQLAEVSRTTFFNYFPTKEHLFTYYGWCFSAKLIIALKGQENFITSTYDKIKFVFNFTIEEDHEYRKLFPIFISHILRRDMGIINDVKFTRADLLYQFNEEKDFYIEEEIVKLPTVAEVFVSLLKEGIEAGEFKTDTNLRKVVMHLLSLYFSPPVTYKFMREVYSLEEAYELLLGDILAPILQ